MNMKYFFCLFYLFIMIIHPVSAQGCKKSCGASTGCGSNNMNAADFASQGEILACINNCDTGNPEFGRARVIGMTDKSGYEIEWITHSKASHIGQKSTVKSIIHQSHPATWSELTPGRMILFGDGQIFKKGKLKSADETTAKINIEWSANGVLKTMNMPLKSIRIIE